ncbi:hypothetical protein BC941DRAFT_420068 [Chlamydoabsidia padenii]|nr:hypothetical protein BC941DRAFT_420068 [Chlamydoabsidia padenii]
MLVLCNVTRNDNDDNGLDFQLLQRKHSNGWQAALLWKWVAELQAGKLLVGILGYNVLSRRTVWH